MICPRYESEFVRVDSNREMEISEINCSDCGFGFQAPVPEECIERMWAVITKEDTPDDGYQEVDMTFIEWLRENYNYTGDGSYFDMQSQYSADECDQMYEQYVAETGGYHGYADLYKLNEVLRRIK